MRSHRRLLIAVAAVLVILILAVALGGFYYSETIKSEVLSAEQDADRFDLVVESVSGQRVTLRPTEAASTSGTWTKAGVYGLEWDGGYGQISLIHELTPSRVVREFRLIEGTIEPGVAARTDNFAFSGDPLRALGLPFADIPLEGPLGPLPAWHVPASGDVWAILVHGKGANRDEMLRPLRVVHSAGFPTLVVTYRNDVGAPRAPNERYSYGKDEWRDIEAAAEFALAQGATKLVLVGSSMGGAIVMSFLYNSEHRSSVAAAILDAPLLDLHATVAWRARDLGPSPAIRFGLWASKTRFGLDWNDYDYLRRADGLSVPILLFHGRKDRSVQLATSEELRTRRPDIVTLVTHPEAGHVQSWNLNPVAYEEALLKFFAAVSLLSGGQVE